MKANITDSVIVIDPGHGGTTKVGGSSPNNATGPRGTKEKDLTLDIAKRTLRFLVDQLKYKNVSLTRDGDKNLSLRDRAKVALDNRASAFVSIHFNGFNDPNTQGTETWTHAVATDASRLLARSVQQRVLAATGYRNRGLQAKALDVLYMGYHHAQTAACLAEISFITQVADEDRLNHGMNEKPPYPYREELGKAIAYAIDDFLKGSSGGGDVRSLNDAEEDGLDCEAITGPFHDSEHDEERGMER